jgi:hypothetical protein
LALLTAALLLPLDISRLISAAELTGAAEDVAGDRRLESFLTAFSVGCTADTPRLRDLRFLRRFFLDDISTLPFRFAIHA